MKPWLAAHGYALRSALVRLARRPLGTLLEASVLAIALALPVAFLLAVENLRALTARHPATPEISVYLELDATPADAARLAERLNGIPDAQAVYFVSKAEAAAHLRRSAGLGDVLEALPENPLPDAFTVRVPGAGPDRLEALRAEVSGWPRVARAQVDSDWGRRLDALLRAGRTAGVALGLVLAVAMVAITFNTVRLQMLQQREEIELSRLLGATEAFVRRPYLYFGTLQGLLGGCLALALVAAAHGLAARELAFLSVAYETSLSLRPLPWGGAAVVVATACALGYVAAWLCAARAAGARDLRP